jgi:hypothetical protein
MFMPVSCGGSRAPANLWWEQNGVMYQIQIKLKSSTTEKEQERILVETGNLTVTPLRSVAKPARLPIPAPPAGALPIGLLARRTLVSATSGDAAGLLTRVRWRGVFASGVYLHVIARSGQPRIADVERALGTRKRPRVGTRRTENALSTRALTYWPAGACSLVSRDIGRRGGASLPSPLPQDLDSSVFFRVAACATIDGYDAATGPG